MQIILDEKDLRKAVEKYVQEHPELNLNEKYAVSFLNRQGGKLVQIVSTEIVAVLCTNE